MPAHLPEIPPSPPSSPHQPSDRRRAADLPVLAALFLRLGLTAFGGPAAHIALMRQEVVERRRWLTAEEFLDLLGACSLIPGPSSTELAIFIGRQRAGFAGLALAGLCFILPAALLVGIMAWAYVRLGRLPQVAGVLWGVKPVVIAVIAQAIWGLGRTALKSRLLVAVGVAATAAGVLGANPLPLLVVAGLAVAAAELVRHRTSGTRKGVGALLALLAFVAVLVAAPTALGAVAAQHAARQPGLAPILMAFLRLGSIVYGSGYVLLAFLRDDLVARRGWLTSAQLLDAVAVGQVTPGPVFTTATFIGFLLDGPRGAVVATVGMFLPAFVLVALAGGALPRLRRAPAAAAFLDGVNVAALALMATVTWQLARDTLRGPAPVAMALAAAALLVRFRVNSAWLLLAAAVMGLVVAR